MQYSKLFHALEKKSAFTTHKIRSASLFTAVKSVLDGAFLTVTNIGRNLKGDAKVKNKIKRVDRLLSNPELFADKELIYKSINNHIFKYINNVILLVDWSPFKHKRDFGVLKATVALNGCSIPVYQEVHKYNNLICIKRQKRFLKNLQSVLPASCKVTVVTDMGFLSDWFKFVLEMGWDFVGRIRSDCKYSIENKAWDKLGNYKASMKPEKFENCQLFKSKPMTANLIIYKKYNKKTKRKFSSAPIIKQYEKSNYLPWFLVTSLKSSAKKICMIYQNRMKIEATFRDVKSVRFGMGLNQSLQQTKSIIRRENLLLISHIAYCLLIIIGWSAEKNKLHYDFQANSIKYKRIISMVFLGKQMIKQCIEKINIRDILRSAKLMAREINTLAHQLTFCGDH